MVVDVSSVTGTSVHWVPTVSVVDLTVVVDAVIVSTAMVVLRVLNESEPVERVVAPFWVVPA